MGMLILGTFAAIALGMGVGGFAAHKLGVHEAIGQLAGVALVGLAAFLWMKADDRKRAQARAPSPAVATAPAGTASSPAATSHAMVTAAPDPSADASPAETVGGPHPSANTHTTEAHTASMSTPAGELLTADGTPAAEDVTAGAGWSSLEGGGAEQRSDLLALESTGASEPTSPGIVGAFR